MTAPVGEVTTPMTRGQIGQRLFVFVVEQAFGGEFFAALFEQREQRADAGGFDLLDDDLV